jgi:hypothetical protein
MSTTSPKLGVVEAVTAATNEGMPDCWNAYTRADYTLSRFLRTPAGALARRMRSDEKDAADMRWWAECPEFAPKNYLMEKRS